MEALMERVEVEELECQHPHTEIEEQVEDYFDPGNYYGHGQRSHNVLVCVDCKEVIDETPDADGGYDD